MSKRSEAITPVLLNRLEAARFLGVSDWHMGNLVRKGEIPFIKLGTSKRYPVKALEQWIAANTEYKVLANQGFDSTNCSLVSS